ALKMGCTNSRQTPGVASSAAELGRSVSATLLQNPSHGQQDAAEKKVAQVPDDQVYDLAQSSLGAVEQAPNSTRPETWAVCDAAWKRANEIGSEAMKAWPASSEDYQLALKRA
ncbi:unnamed protein product, partial [Polarella glacialis]